MTDLVKLDALLHSDGSPEGCMLLVDLDGFMTGVICCPVLIMPSEWLPVALGGAAGEVPGEIISLIMERHNEIVAGLNNRPRFIEPIFWQAPEGHVIAMDWCEGFMRAVALRQSEWDAFQRTKKGQTWMQPIIDHIFDEQGRSMSGAKEEELDAHLDRSANNIPRTVPLIFAHWQARRSRPPNGI